MEIEKTALSGLMVVSLSVQHDARGFFIEHYNKQVFAENGIDYEFVQVNHSHSAPKVLRGLHYQYDPAQAKLVSVLTGAIWDVVVDIRPWSLTYGQSHAIELTASEGTALWVPAGFAHGFCVIGDAPADVYYMTDGHYNPETEGGIKYDDATLNIPWPVDEPIISERDKQLPDWEYYRSHIPDWEKE